MLYDNIGCFRADLFVTERKFSGLVNNFGSREGVNESWVASEF